MRFNQKTKIHNVK